MKIVILDGYSVNPGDLSWDKIKEFGEVIVYERTRKSEIVERSKDADIILTNKVAINKAILDELPNLKLIGVLATGYNIIDTLTAKEKGIIVCNIPAYSTNSVAQMVFAHLLNIANNVGHFANENRKGRWENNADFCYWDTPLMELHNKNIGIVGLGNTGKKVAEIALAFGMNVYAYTSKSQEALPQGIKKAELKEMFSVCDIISLHCPLTDNTKNLINKDNLKHFKKGSILINTSRGPVINEDDVAEALKNGTLYAFGADVLSSEPPKKDNPLIHLTNAFITPHVAWATFEARKRLMEITENNIKAFINNKPINVVNK